MSPPHSSPESFPEHDHKHTLVQPADLRKRILMVVIRLHAEHVRGSSASSTGAAIAAAYAQEHLKEDHHTEQTIQSMEGKHFPLAFSFRHHTLPHFTKDDFHRCEFFFYAMAGCQGLIHGEDGTNSPRRSREPQTDPSAPRYLPVNLQRMVRNAMPIFYIDGRKPVVDPASVVDSFGGRGSSVVVDTNASDRSRRTSSSSAELRSEKDQALKTENVHFKTSVEGVDFKRTCSVNCGEIFHVR
ncbi:hypothetical protein LXA43DRAFT_1100306 [Ganoderma leucocontextum]|nr:hypothetical protein LXA43DRAFT_1100306 [Ganoderma leucocontextum]